jgi:hypothetical protein
MPCMRDSACRRMFAFAPIRLDFALPVHDDQTSVTIPCREQQDNPADRIQGNHPAGRRRHPALPAAGRTGRGRQPAVRRRPFSTAMRQCSNCRNSRCAGSRLAARQTGAETHGLNVIGVRGGSEELRQSAAFAGLPTYASVHRAAPANGRIRAPHRQSQWRSTAARARRRRRRPSEPAAAGRQRCSSTGHCVRDSRSMHVAATWWFWPRSMPAPKSLPTAHPHLRALARSRTGRRQRRCRRRASSAPASMPNWSRSPGCIGPSMAAFRRRLAGKPVQVRLTEKPGDEAANCSSSH